MLYLIIIGIIVFIVYAALSNGGDESSHELYEKSYECKCGELLEGHEIYCPSCKKRINWGRIKKYN